MKSKLIGILLALPMLSLFACSENNDEPTTDTTAYSSYYQDLLKCESPRGTLSFNAFVHNASAMSDEYIYELHVPAEGGTYDIALNDDALWVGEAPIKLPDLKTWHSHVKYSLHYAYGFEYGPSDTDDGYTFMFEDDLGVNKSHEWQASFGSMTTGFSKITLNIKPNTTSSIQNHEAVFVFASTAETETPNIHICADIILKIYQEVG